MKKFVHRFQYFKNCVSKNSNFLDNPDQEFINGKAFFLFRRTFFFIYKIILFFCKTTFSLRLNKIKFLSIFFYGKPRRKKNILFMSPTDFTPIWLKFFGKKVKKKSDKKFILLTRKRQAKKSKKKSSRFNNPFFGNKLDKLVFTISPTFLCNRKKIRNFLFKFKYFSFKYLM